MPPSPLDHARSANIETYAYFPHWDHVLSSNLADAQFHMLAMGKPEIVKIEAHVLTYTWLPLLFHQVVHEHIDRLR